MSRALLDEIVDAVLYEGYILYPYRASSKKNARERFTFGRVYPEAYSLAQHGAEPCLVQTECLVETGDQDAVVDVSVRFLHPMAREIGTLGGPVSGRLELPPEFQIVPELRVDGQLFQTWHEAVEHEIKASPSFALSADKPTQISFPFPASRAIEPIRDSGNELKGLIVRRQKALMGRVEIAATALRAGVFKLTVRVLNQTPVPVEELDDAEAVLLRTFASTHTILRVHKGTFVSLMSPPPELTEASEACHNIGTWPVLVGEEQQAQRDTILSSPIILYDYPKIAPESEGPLFDGTEMDEILTLRILTMTEAEKGEMRRVDEQARRLLERTETLPQDSFLRMHGTMRPSHSFRERAPENPNAARTPPRETSETLSFAPENEDGSGRNSRHPVEFDDFFGTDRRLAGVYVAGAFLQAGDRVRLRPKRPSDILDLATAGQTAIIEAVEQDLEQRVHLAVVLENDPGKDLGLLRQPGHRFFYGLDEVEPLREGMP
jgi:hydrogenase maturation protease